MSNTEKKKNRTQKIEDVAAWDWEKAAVGRAKQGRRAVVSVAFSRSDFQLVAQCARHLKAPLSGFIRDAALERAKAQMPIRVIDYSKGNLYSAMILGVSHVSTEGTARAAQISGAARVAATG